MARKAKGKRVAKAGKVPVEAPIEVEAIVASYPDPGGAAERERLLHPTGGYRGREGAPLSATDLNTMTGEMLRKDSTDRLARVRQWMLDDPTFEYDFWRAIRSHALRGMRHAQNAVLRVLYNWQENDNIATALGATMDEARSALTTVAAAANLTLDDLMENFMTFAEMLKDKFPQRFAELRRRIDELAGRDS